MISSTGAQSSKPQFGQMGFMAKLRSNVTEIRQIKNFVAARRPPPECEGCDTVSMRIGQG
jgi:hypothetical protein